MAQRKPYEDGDYRIIPQTLRANLKKARDDVKRLKRQMRFVITLEPADDPMRELGLASDGFRVIVNSRYIANGIAVLGPAHVHGIYLPEVLLLEISISRGAPYGTVEKTSRKARRASRGSGVRVRSSRYLKSRRRVRKIEMDEVALVWPTIEEFLAYAMHEARKKWKTQGKWFVKKGRGHERGIYAVISHEDGILHHKILYEDFCHRKHKYLDFYVASIKRWLKPYKVKKHQRQKVRSYQGMGSAADLWSAKNLTRLAREYMFFRLDWREQMIMREIIGVYNLPDLGCTLRLGRNPISPKAMDLPEATKIAIYVRPKERTRQAKNCIVFEILPPHKTSGKG